MELQEQKSQLESKMIQQEQENSKMQGEAEEMKNQMKLDEIKMNEIATQHQE